MSPTLPVIEHGMIEIVRLEFRYGSTGFGLRVERLAIEAGARVALVGASGCGKTTLLHVLTGILRPQSGEIRVGGLNLAHLSDRQLREFRISRTGLVFQEFELLDYLSVRDNISIAWQINPALARPHDLPQRIWKLATELGIGDLLDRSLNQLSHGERQRVGIGRALVTQPQLVIADEPTAHLDPATRDRMIDLLFEQTGSATLVMTTHDHSLLGRFDRVIDFSQPEQSGIELIAPQFVPSRETS